MENIYFSVNWFNEKPMRFSVMSKSDIANDLQRTSKGIHLVGQNVQFKWKRDVCVGRVLACGSKLEMGVHMKTHMKATKRANGKSVPSTSKQIPAKRRNTNIAKCQIDSVLEQIDESDKHSVLEQIDESDKHTDELTELRTELQDKEHQLKDVLQENDALKARIVLLESCETQVDIENGILLGREFLTTIKAGSSSVNTYARSLFKKLFPVDEVVGYSLMGKGCNANNKQSQPSIDPVRRDAIIGYSLKVFGIYPGSHTFNLAKKDVKKSLSSLILELTKNTNSAVANLSFT